MAHCGLVERLADGAVGKEVRRYEGVPNSINEQAGKIVVRTDNAVGHDALMEVMQ